MRRLLPIRFLPVLAACAALSSLGCGDGLDFENESFPEPLIALSAPPAACGAVGSGSIVFEIEDIVVTQNFPADTPQSRLDVSGIVSGLGPADTVEILLLPYANDCPILGSGLEPATLDGSTFSAQLDYAERGAFRAVLVAHAGELIDLDCATGGSCLSTAAGSFSAVSATIEVILD